MINLDYLEGFDRITFGVYLIGANRLNMIYTQWGTDYPICGDTLAKLEKE